MQDMTPNQPYLLRAFYDWIVDNNLTPYMVVAADYPGVEVPLQFVNNGQIVLNVSPSACVNFAIDLTMISFNARFSGQPMVVSFPCEAVAAIYAKENGAGTAFQVPEFVLEDKAALSTISDTGKPKDTCVEMNEEEGKSAKSSENDMPDMTHTPSKKSKPNLRVIK